MTLECPSCGAPLKRTRRIRDPVTRDPTFEYVCPRCKTRYRGGRDGYLEDAR